MSAAPLSEPVLHRLYLARQALDQGRRLAADPLPYSRMQGVMALDDAVEWTTLTLLSILQVRAKRDGALSEYLTPLVAARPALGSHTGPAETLRRLRDRVKHDGIVPSPEDARRAAVEVESFLRAAIREVLEREVEEISPADLITDAAAKSHLVAAQEAFAAENFSAVIIEARIALAIGTRAVPGAPPYQEDPLELARRLVERITVVIPAVGPFAGDVRELVRILAGPVTFLHLGIDQDELDRFLAVTPTVHVFESGDFQVQHQQRVEPSRERAVFALDFASRVLFRLQERQRRRRV